jgi:alpha-glucosidase
MQNVVVPAELIHDPRGKGNPEYSRDPQRSPMQWDSGPNAGFCPPEVQPWLPVSDDYQTYNVDVEQQEAHSFLTLVHTLLGLRRSSPALSVGSQRILNQPNPDCFVYLRELAEQRYLVVLNFTAEEQVVTLQEQGQGKVLLSTQPDHEGQVALGEIHLRGNEGLLIEVN